MNHRRSALPRTLAPACAVAALLLASGCGSSGGDEVSTSARAFAGVWDPVSVQNDAAYGTRFVAVSSDGRYYTEYQESDEGNCYVATELRIEPLGLQPVPTPAPNPPDSLTDEDTIEITGEIPTFRLSDGRNFAALDIGTGLHVSDGSPRDDRAILTWLGTGSTGAQAEWYSVDGLTEADLQRCGA